MKNGIITHVTLKDGGEVEIKCRTNYTLVGSPKLVCTNGKWNDSLPSCGGNWTIMEIYCHNLTHLRSLYPIGQKETNNQKIGFL